MQIEPGREHLYPDIGRGLHGYIVILAILMTPSMRIRLKMAIPIVRGAVLSRLVRLEIIPAFVFETAIMIMVVAGVTDQAEPEADQGETSDHKAGRYRHAGWVIR